MLCITEHAWLANKNLPRLPSNALQQDGTFHCNKLKNFWHAFQRDYIETLSRFLTTLFSCLRHFFRNNYNKLDSPNFSCPASFSRTNLNQPRFVHLKFTSCFTLPLCWNSDNSEIARSLFFSPLFSTNQRECETLKATLECGDVIGAYAVWQKFGLPAHVIIKWLECSFYKTCSAPRKLKWFLPSYFEI